MTKKKVDELFFLLFCEKNSDGTRHLRLRGNELIHRIGRRLNKDDMLELATFLRNNPWVTSLDLAYNDLTDDGIKILAEEVFDEENNIKVLNLIHCDICAEGMEWLSSAKNLNLKDIRLVGNKLGSAGARFIGRLLENCPNLEGLDIAETDLVLESIESLLMIIEKSNLKLLNISRIIPASYYSQYSNSTLADDLGVLLKLNITLEELRVQKCEFDGHDVEILIGGLQFHKNLVMLDLAANRISDTGVCHLANWLRTRPNLLALRIPSNKITTKGAQALGYTVSFSRLRLLDIHNNRIGDQGLSELLDSFKKSTQLRIFFVWGNIFGQMSLNKLDRAIKCGVINQECTDVKIYTVDGKKHAAYYPTNHFIQNSYCVAPHGYPSALKIIRNQMPLSHPRPYLDLQFIDRIDRQE